MVIYISMGRNCKFTNGDAKTSPKVSENSLTVSKLF
jgi:hypothetical protein